MKKFKIEIKNRWTGDVIFTYESKKEATIKEAVEQAVKERVSLASADLRSADLRSADLSLADLRSANLRLADLRSAHLRSAIKLPIYCRWTHGITNENLIHIGCEKRSIEDWDKFFESDEILTTERNTQEFKQIEAVYNAYKAYLTVLNK